MCGIAGFLGGERFPSEASAVDRTRDGGAPLRIVVPTTPESGSTARPRPHWPTVVWPSLIPSPAGRQPMQSVSGEASSSSMARSTTTSTSGGRSRPSVRTPGPGGGIPIRKRCWPPSSIGGWRRRCGRPPACSPSRSGTGRTGRSLWPATGWAKKPLYYGWQNGVFLFGSELKALAAHPCIRGRNQQGCAHPAPAPRLHCIPLVDLPGSAKAAGRVLTSRWPPALHRNSAPANCRNREVTGHCGMW